MRRTLQQETSLFSGKGKKLSTNNNYIVERPKTTFEPNNQLDYDQDQVIRVTDPEEESLNKAINASSNDLTNSQVSSQTGRQYVSESLLAKRGRFATEARMKANRVFGKTIKIQNQLKNDPSG